MRIRLAAHLPLAIMGFVVLTTTGCRPAPEPPPPTTEEALPAFDPFEQALISRALKRIERNGQSVMLIAHRISNTAEIPTVCGVYVIDGDPHEQKRYFLSRSNETWLLDDQSDDKWQRNCGEGQ